VKGVLCPETSKVRYLTYGKALAALDKVQDLAKPVDAVTGLRPLTGSVYSCDACASFHVSSRKFTLAKKRGRGKSRRGLVRKTA
jgi:hypothetical protein